MAPILMNCFVALSCGDVEFCVQYLQGFVNCFWETPELPAGPGNIYMHASDAASFAESRILAQTKSNGHSEA